tara:strand:+ start:76 stop:597 length:522 start_codon:yes stop_codon:yes gene_type:complete
LAVSREDVKKNKAMQSILRGETPEKQIQVGYGSKIEKHGDIISPLSEIMKEARMPWFCPSCKKVMKKRLDNKTWAIYNHCFECQLEFENKLRIAGKYDDWKDNKVKENKLSWIKDQKQKLKEFANQKTPEYLLQTRPDGYSVDKEKWSLNSEELKEKAKEALEYLNKLEESLS